MNQLGQLSSMEILSIQGNPEVAEVAVARFRNSERCCIEMVDGLAPPLPREKKWIINVSTQFGCPVGCPFCDAAADYAGNVSTEELLAQVGWALGRHPELVTGCQKLKVHFARMGEPSLNPAVLDAIKALPSIIHNDNLWACVATVAVSGRENWFERLYNLKERLFRGRFQLQFSVQSTNESHRKRLMPIKHWSLAQIAEYGRLFYQPGDRKVVLNFALARDVDFDVGVILDTFDPRAFAAKLTPVNPTAAGSAAGFETILRSEHESSINQACEALNLHGFDVVLSIGDEREDQVGSNCGQAVRVARHQDLDFNPPADKSINSISA